MLATYKRALILGATFIENDLKTMREEAIRLDDLRIDGRGYSISHCLEADVLKVAEWASAAALLRAAAEND